MVHIVESKVEGNFWDNSPEIENCFNEQSGSHDFRTGWSGVADPSIRFDGLEELSDIYQGRDKEALKPTDSNSAHIAEMEGVRVLPPVAALPEDMQEFIKGLEDKTPQEKVEAIQAFVLTRMDFKIENDSLLSSLKDIISKGFSGDCDDHAVLTAALLKYAGIPAEDIHFVGGSASYGDGENFGHAVVVVTVDGKDVMLDMNLEKPIIIDGINGKGEVALEQNPNGVVVPVTFVPWFSMGMADGDPVYTYPEYRELMSLSEFVGMGVSSPEVSGVSDMMELTSTLNTSL